MLVAPITLAAQALGQTEPPAREHALIIPPHNVLSVRTDRIRAQAQYLQAAGDFLVDVAVARRHHALAAQQEIRNWRATSRQLRSVVMH
jgi:hypothetical protein